MSTTAQHRRGSAALSRDIDARFDKKDPAIERLKGSLKIAHAERDAALRKVADLEDELKRARRCLASARVSHEIQREGWAATESDLRFKLAFAANHIRKLRQPTDKPNK